MKKLNTLLLFITAICITSCTVVGTLYKVSDNRDEYIFNKELLGKWGVSKDSSTYYYEIDTLPHERGKIYSILIIQSNTDNTVDTTIFAGYLFKLNDWYYIDCWYKLEADIKDYLSVRHFILRLDFKSKDEIELMPLMPDVLIKLIDEKKLHLSYARFPVRSKEVKYDYLILNKPGELKKALAATRAFPELYKEKELYYRLKH
jgi:hypothetical protein